jgi:putative transposase
MDVTTRRRSCAIQGDQPVLTMGLSYVGSITHDYVSHDITTLFIALDVANGQVISRVRAQHRHQESIDFLRQIDKQTSPKLDLHLIVDNSSPKSAPWARRGCCATRACTHCTPTYSSWLNQVERWFDLITERAIRRNSFTSVRELKQRIKLASSYSCKDTTPTHRRFSGLPPPTRSCRRSNESRSVFLRQYTSCRLDRDLM